VDLTVADAVLLATRSGASKTDICKRQIETENRNKLGFFFQFIYLGIDHDHLMFYLNL